MRPSLFIITLLTVSYLGSAYGAKASKKEVIWPADQIQFVEMPEAKGVSQAILWGNPKKEAHASLIKFAAGTRHALHTHTHSAKLVIISGTFFYAPENGAEQKLGSGSYLMIPGGTKHSSGCDGECTFFMEASGKWDMNIVGSKSAGTKKKDTETN